MDGKTADDRIRTETSTRGLGERISEEARNLSDRASQALENEPRTYPREEHREGRIARTIEQQTAKVPSDIFLWAALGSMGMSLALELMGEEKKANFIGHWAPTLLIFGLYNKMVKLHGSEGM